MVLAVNFAEDFAEISRAVIRYENAAVRSRDIDAIQILRIDVDPAVIHRPGIQSRHVLPCFAIIEAAENPAACADPIGRLRPSAAATPGAPRRPQFSPL